MICDMMPMIDEESSDDLLSSNSEDDTLDQLANDAKKIAKQKNLPPIKSNKKLHRVSSDLEKIGNNPLSVQVSNESNSSGVTGSTSGAGADRAVHNGHGSPETNDDKLSLEDDEIQISSNQSHNQSSSASNLETDSSRKSSAQNNSEIRSSSPQTHTTAPDRPQVHPGHHLDQNSLDQDDINFVANNCSTYSTDFPEHHSSSNGNANMNLVVNPHQQEQQQHHQQQPNHDNRNIAFLPSKSDIRALFSERDQFQEELIKLQDQLALSEQDRLTGLEEIEKLNRSLAEKRPESTLELNQMLDDARETIRELLEEVQDLRAERSNTKLLLEHLEYLVSRHERSLRATVLKRREKENSQATSSEVEVLKALKSLFQHHKTLDEKVREKLRIEVEKNVMLSKEIDVLKARGFGVSTGKETDTDIHVDSNASMIPQSDSKLDLMECRLVNQQRELVSFQHRTTDLESELDIKANKIKQDADKIRVLMERVESLENTIENERQISKNLPTVEAKLAEKDKLLNNANEKTSSIEERLKETEVWLDEAREEVKILRHRERTSNEHASKQAETIDLLLQRDGERLQRENKLVQDIESLKIAQASTSSIHAVGVGVGALGGLSLNATPMGTLTHSAHSPHSPLGGRPSVGHQTTTSSLGIPSLNNSLNNSNNNTLQKNASLMNARVLQKQIDQISAEISALQNQRFNSSSQSGKSASAVSQKSSSIVSGHVSGASSVNLRESSGYIFESFTNFSSLLFLASSSLSKGMIASISCLIPSRTSFSPSPLKS